MKKDWTEVLKQKVDAYVPDDMQLPGFEDLKKKMLAAGAGADAGAPKGASVPMRRGLKWVAAAASLVSNAVQGCICIALGNALMFVLSKIGYINELTDE